MNTEEAQLQFAYNRWANRRVLEAAREVAPQDLMLDRRSSFGSIHGTLLHIISGEWRWLQNWLGKPYDEEFRPEDYPDVAALEARWKQVVSDQQKFVDGLTDARLQARSVVRGAERPLAHTLQHLLHHSAYHRGQVSTLLRQAGHTPPSIDFLVFLGMFAEPTA
jgi:uncharacterized damage-inducible protein DinB